MNRRQFLRTSAVVGAVYHRLFAGQGTALPGSAIPQWAHALPRLDATGGGTIQTVIAPDPTAEFTIQMAEFRANILPPSFRAATGLPYAGTRVWGYASGAVGIVPRDTYVGPVVVAKRGVATQIRFANNLPMMAGGGGLAGTFKEWVDRSIDWANPMKTDPLNMGDFPIPVVPHLHGGEIPPELDGGPDAWFTNNPACQGHAYHTLDRDRTAGNEAIYRYPNTQEAAPIWFHDHALGLTRLNVYAGLAGAYMITDPNLALPGGLHPAGLRQPSGSVEYTIPIVLQDRMFDVNGELYFPNIGLNPEHPQWVPEFIGDVMVVNGKAWPYLAVEPKRYRFLFLNGSNARTYEMFIANPVTKVMGPAMWQIGTDGGYLDQAVKIDPNAPKGQLQVLRMMPGERADIIIDFSGVPGQTLILRNNARTPYTKGAPANGPMAQVLQFRVGTGPVADSSYNPAVTPAIRTNGGKIVRLPGTPGGSPYPAGITTRQLTLNEVMGMGGPLEVLVNNTTYGGTDRPDFKRVTTGGRTEFYSELPNEGETEIWEIVNLTADAHPIHFHLVQVQIINRQGFNLNKYTTAYNASFPGGLFKGGYGPPLNYKTGNLRGALGGNPDITPYLQGPVSPPPLNEQGWKDTIIMFSGEVTRVAIRFAPTDKALGAADLRFPFNPNGKSMEHGYVFHCHIIDHEDNEMMRPMQVQAKDGPARSVTNY